MSRHVVDIANPNAGETHAVIGWDRMLERYFVQIYASEGDDEKVTREWEGEGLSELVENGILLVMPADLVGQLMYEATGFANANGCIDWRHSEPERR